MKIKNLFAAGLIAISGAFTLATITTHDAMAAFDPDAASGGCAPTSLYKQGKGKSKDEVKTIADCNLPKESTDNDLMDKSSTIINVIVGAVGIIAVAVIVIGGILYVTSTGDSAKTKRAQNTILYGVVGLVIAILAYAIVNFVLKSIF